MGADPAQLHRSSPEKCNRPWQSLSHDVAGCGSGYSVGCSVKRILILAAIAAATSLSACGDDDAGPLAPAMKGKFLCALTYDPQPNRIGLDETKGCQAMIFYEKDWLGRLTVRSQLVIAVPQGVGTIEADIAPLPVTIENGQVCRVQSADDAKAMSFKVAGQDVPEAIQERAKQSAVAYLTKYAGRKICQTITSDDGGVSESTTIDGQPAPEFDQDHNQVIWASRDQDYYLNGFGAR